MDYRERSEREDYRDKDRGRDRDRDRGERGASSRVPEPSTSRRSRSRERDDGGRRRKDGDRRRDRPAVDEFGRVVNFDREKSMSPDRPRKFDPRNLRRSETPEPEAEVAMKEAPRLKNEHLFQVTILWSCFSKGACL